MEIAGHAQHQDIRRVAHAHWDGRAALGQGPGGRFDRGYRPGLHVEDFTELTEHRVNREYLFPHPLLHRFADGLELMAHVLVLRAPQPVVTVHGRGIMVGCNGLPAGKAGDQHLGAAAESAIGIARAVPDQDHQVGIDQQAVALDAVAHRVLAEILQVGRFAVVIDQPSRVELIDDLLAQVPVEFFKGVLPMQADTA